VSNVIKSINLLQKFDAKNVISAEFLTEEIAKSPPIRSTINSKSVHMNFAGEALKNVRINNLLHDLCAGNDANSLELVKCVINEDPRKNL
jgi:hypothetical protein